MGNSSVLIVVSFFSMPPVTSPPTPKKKRKVYTVVVSFLIKTIINPNHGFIYKNAYHFFFDIYK